MTGPGYSGLILLSACYFSGRSPIRNGEKRTLPKPLQISLGVLSVICLAGVLIINFFPGTLSPDNKENWGEGDFTLDMYGWHNLEKDFQHIVNQQENTGLVQPGSVVISNRWFTAAHLDYFVAMPLKKELVAIGDTADIHQ